MSVEYTTGNLLQWPAGINVIAHGVSLQSKFGAGIAKQIGEQYPLAKDSYFAALSGPERAQLGDIDVVPVDDRTRRIVNCFTQVETGTDKRQLNYEALYVCLSDLKDLLETAYREDRIWTLGLPQWIGCGLASGSAAIVRAMVHDLYEPSPIRCVVVEYSGK